MKYIGSRLKIELQKERGSYTQLAERMKKYRKPRKNFGKDEYNLLPLFNDGHNITINTLSALMKETGKSLDFFIDFDPGEAPNPDNNNNPPGSNNTIALLRQENDYLKEIIKLKNDLLSAQKKIIDKLDWDTNRTK